MTNWTELKHGTHNSDRSYHSGASATGSCTRDSGAGDSVETESDIDGQLIDQTNLPLVNQHHPMMTSTNKWHYPTGQSDQGIVRSPTNSGKFASTYVRGKPTFTTFVGDSDTESVQIVDYTKANV